LMNLRLQRFGASSDAKIIEKKLDGLKWNAPPIFTNLA
jgi:hypothetical protein